MARYWYQAKDNMRTILHKTRKIFIYTFLQCYSIPIKIIKKGKKTLRTCIKNFNLIYYQAYMKSLIQYKNPEGKL